jgi:predicted HD phosphohydrolase
VTLTKLSELIDLLAGMGDSPGEADGLSELDHGLQCAHELARVRPDDAELQVAGLVHDIGHQFAPDDAHGRIGAEHVRALLGDRVAALVEAHVPAKRYLVATDPSYGTVLSGPSVMSLGFQGGPLSPEAVAEFESSPYAADAVVLRRADDAAKVPGRVVPPLKHWIPLLGGVAG